MKTAHCNWDIAELGISHIQQLEGLSLSPPSLICKQKMGSAQGKEQGQVTPQASTVAGSTGFPPRASCSALSGCLLHTEASEWLSPCFLPRVKARQAHTGKLGTRSEVQNLRREAQSPFLPGQISGAATGQQSFSSGYQRLGVRAEGAFPLC